MQYCVMCHNPGTTDANSGNVLTMSTMVHKIHAGRLLASQLASGGEHYMIWGYRDSKHDYSEVGFPQDLRNCTMCHTARQPEARRRATTGRRGPSKEACLTCHASKAGSDWEASHTAIASVAASAGGQRRWTSRMRSARTATPQGVTSAPTASTGTRTRRTRRSTR